MFVRITEDVYRQIFELSNEGIWIASPDGVTLLVNKKMADMLGYTPEEMVGRVGVEFLVPGQDALVDQTRRDLSKNIRSQNELQLICKDNTVIWSIVNSSPLFDKDGRHIANISIHTDITQRKKVEEFIKKQAKLIDLSPDGIIVRKMDGTIIFWSKGAEKIYGWSCEEALGKKTDDLLQTRFPTSFDDVIWEIMRSKSWSGELVHKTKSGKEVIVQSRWLPESEQGEVIDELLESNVDITERKKAEDALKQVKAQLELHSKNLEELVEERTRELKDSECLAAIGAAAGMVGHDIRNPLQAIASDMFLIENDVALLSESQVKKCLQESIASVQTNLFYIEKIVADLQDFSRPLKPSCETIDVNHVIEEVMLLVFVSENHQVVIEVDEGFSVFYSDRSMVKRILFNLVNNALQAMPECGILTVSAHRVAGRVVFVVEDTGEGIPEDVRSKLFSPLVTSKAKGQGLGLAVVKRLVECLHGSVSFQSEIGVGTKFTVDFPFRLSKG